MSSELEPQVNTVDEDDKDDLFSECEFNFTDREWQMIQQAGVTAELDAIKHFVTHVSVPSAAECEHAINGISLLDIRYPCKSCLNLDLNSTMLWKKCGQIYW